MLIANNIKEKNIPTSPGCYKFINKDKKVIYIGKAANLRSRVLSYWRESANLTPAKQAMLKEITGIDWIETESEIEALLLEANLIKKYQPYYNVDLRDDKRFSYIKISVGDEIPGLFLSRKIDRSGQYFGPFTSGTAVRETVKALRKIWPYCTERKVKLKPCFYYQIGRCTGVCGGKFDIKKYKDKIIKPIILFLEGKKDKVVHQIELKIKNYELRIKSYESGKNKYSLSANEYENIRNELNFLKFQLLNMKNVLEHTKIISIGDKYAADVVELAKILGLGQVPERIEGYDISNIFGQEAVGSMVVFSGGEPNKNEYRKFKIRVGQGEANDVGMLKEVLERRFKHSGNGSEKSIEKSRIVYLNEMSDEQNINQKSKIQNPKLQHWPLPDLIIIDGGKAQLNAATRVLKKNKLNIMAIAISKGEGLRSALAPDKLFFPGEKKQLELPLASPALHIIKRVRDEAHRFSIGYHRLLKRKKLFG